MIEVHRRSIVGAGGKTRQALSATHVAEARSLAGCLRPPFPVRLAARPALRVDYAIYNNLFDFNRERYDLKSSICNPKPPGAFRLSAGTV